MSPAFIFEGCGTREAVKQFRGHVFPRWFSVTVSLLSALFAAAGLFFFLGGRHKLALYYAGSALLLLVFNLAGKAFLVRRLSSVLDQILGGDPGFAVCFYENYFSIVRQKDQKLIPVYYSRINTLRGFLMVMAAAGKVPCRNKRTLTRGPRKNRLYRSPSAPVQAVCYP